MKIHQITVIGQNQVEFLERELDERLGPDEILLRTESTFISTGTELAIYTGVAPQVFQKGGWCEYPWNAGYANVGIVQAIGKDVAGVKAGQRVFTLGSHSSFIKINQRQLVVAVPEAMDPVTAAATRMAGVAFSGVAVVELGIGPSVVVFGLGMVGNLAAQCFGILGARVIGVDPVSARRELARRCGIAHTVGGSVEDVKRQISDLTAGRLADIVVDASGLSGVVLESLACTARFGQLILLGSPRAPLQGNITALLADIHLRNITVRGALEWFMPIHPTISSGDHPLPGQSLYHKQQTIFNWVLSGQLKIDPLISHRLPPARIKEAYEGLLRQPDSYTGVTLDWR